ncbi:MAG TPA: DUF2071 domain-containing protein [Frankiaceae bacterium]|nr:DUF2071 domain-containing protein [Frankiaceae bacterium]
MQPSGTSPSHQIVAPNAEPVVRRPPRTVRYPVFTQEWLDLTYLHWRYEPDVVARHLPAGVRPDVHDGSAWVGLIPFRMRRVTILGTPALPYLSSFLETNVRTYGIDSRGRRVVVFLSLDADRLLPVLAARVSYRLPYIWSAMSAERSGDIREYRCRRRGPGQRPQSRIRVRVGARVGQPTELDDFLSARWGLASRWYGRTVHAPVAHEPWPLYHAELLELSDELVTSHGLPQPEGAPHVLWSPGVHVRIGRPRTMPPVTSR